MIRTTAPTLDDKIYYFLSTSFGQCTWYVYYRWQEEFGEGVYPVYRNRETKAQGFNHGKTWLKNFREPSEVKGLDYIPKEKDAIVFDGNYGHCVFIEKDNGDGTYLISQYNLDVEKGFSTATWKLGERLKGKVASTGMPLGYLHYPNSKEDDYKALYQEAKKKLDKIKAIVG